MDHGGTNWLNRLFGSDRRARVRFSSPDLVVFCWEAGESIPHSVLDASSSGMLMATDERWFPGTIIALTLQRKGAHEYDRNRAVAVKGEVVRVDKRGIGIEFIVPNVGSGAMGRHSSAGADMKKLEDFLKLTTKETGQAIIEYLLLLPIVLVLLLNMVNLAGFFFAWIAVSNAARAGANYAVLSGAAAGFLPTPTAGKIKSLVAADISSLPNNASLVMNICQNKNGTVTTLSGTCTSIPSDSEPTEYVLTSVDVTYTYVPFIPAGFKFVGLNVYITIPPTVVHRRAVMRVLQ
jgi:uncharacterized protein (UPF0333 family)